MSEKILFVDDEEYVLQSFKRELGYQFALDTASSGAEGLELLASQGSYAVVVADYRMPRMDGVQFLTRVMSGYPDTVRLMLTGNADMGTAIQAINEGQIFRFLTKPCPPDQLTRSLQAGLRQHQLVIAEKELLERTLVESIQMLTELLSIVNQKAYGKSQRVSDLVAHVGRTLKLEGAWQYETAAALSQLGWISFPPDLLNKLAANQQLTPGETIFFLKHPLVAKKLLGKIPRLEAIATIIERQERSIDDLCLDEGCGELYFVDLGAHILKVCLDYDTEITRGLSHKEALQALNARSNIYKREILEALGTLRSFEPDTERPAASAQKVEGLRLDDLDIGMILAAPLKNSMNEVLAPEGTVITRRKLIEIFSLAKEPGYVVEPIYVRPGYRRQE